MSVMVIIAPCPITFSNSPHIAWPVEQRNLRPLRETVDLLFVLLRELFYKVPRQNRQIAHALRERRRLNLNHREPEYQVFTKLALRNLVAQNLFWWPPPRARPLFAG